MWHQAELGQFLRDRRSRRTPEQLGLRASTRRRVPGLRREEVAAAAGISVEYYTRLEQGRAARPSANVLDALASALDLTAAEHRHLGDLAGRAETGTQQPDGAEHARPALVSLLESMSSVGAVVIDYRFDVLAWNSIASALLFDFGAVAEPNLARNLFLNPDTHRRFPDWEELARVTAAELRLALGQHPRDARLRTLISELRADGERFARYWNERNVSDRTHGQKRFWSPAVGELTLNYENFLIPDTPGHRMVTVAAPAGTVDADKLALLALSTSPREDGSIARETDATSPEYS